MWSLKGQRLVGPSGDEIIMTGTATQFFFLGMAVPRPKHCIKAA